MSEANHFLRRLLTPWRSRGPIGVRRLVGFAAGLRSISRAVLAVEKPLARLIVGTTLAAAFIARRQPTRAGLSRRSPSSPRSVTHVRALRCRRRAS